ncbi:MAG: dienelactone hydrolase family protein, partial [Carnobacterium sp.]
PLRNIELPDLTNTPIFIGAGINDPICPAEESKELKNTLEAAGAEVTIEWGNQGHSLTQLEVTAAANWYRRQFY